MPTKLSRTKIVVLVILVLSGLFIILQVENSKRALGSLALHIASYRETSQAILEQPTPTPYIPINSENESIVIPNTEPSIGITYIPQQQNQADDVEWGVAREVDEGTYTIRVGSDENMTTPQEALEALNAYRNVNGKSSLTWDDNLAAYAQSRADHFRNIGNTDKHAGFNSYLENEDGFNKLGFRRVGENSYYGGKLSGVHIIEWVFAKSPGHDANQKDSGWSHVGIGVTDTSVNLIFAGEKM